MAVMDQAHLQLKMVYNEKKSCEEKLTDIEEENKLAQVKTAKRIRVDFVFK